MTTLATENKTVTQPILQSHPQEILTSEIKSKNILKIERILASTSTSDTHNQVFKELVLTDFKPETNWQRLFTDPRKN